MRVPGNQWVLLILVALTAPLWLAVLVLAFCLLALDWLIAMVMTPMRQRKNYKWWELPPL